MVILFYLGIPFFETSAKENKNIEQVFSQIAKEIKDKILVNQEQGFIKKPNKLDNRKNDKSQCGC